MFKSTKMKNIFIIYKIEELYENKAYKMANLNMSIQR